MYHVGLLLYPRVCFWIDCWDGCLWLPLLLLLLWDQIGGFGLIGVLQRRLEEL